MSYDPVLRYFTGTLSGSLGSIRNDSLKSACRLTESPEVIITMAAIPQRHHKFRIKRQGLGEIQHRLIVVFHFRMHRAAIVESLKIIGIQFQRLLRSANASANWPRLV